MAGKTKQEQAMITNLTDAGCDDGQIERFMSLIAQGKTKEGLALLATHRKCLLDCYHAEQKKIDCLDYLIYAMKKHSL